MSDCLFCKIAAGEIPADVVYEDDKIMVFKDITPKTEVHLLMIPKEHIESLARLDDSHDELLSYMLKKLADIAQQHGLSSGFRSIINTGKGGGQEVFHLHIHLLGGNNLPGF
jgi:histidine triad (HIT) family protein